MMPAFIEVLNAIQALGIVCIAILLSLLIPCNPRYNPIGGINILGSIIAKKILSSQNAPSQLRLSGALSLIIVTSVALLFLLIWKKVSTIDLVLDIFILWISLDVFYFKKLITNSHQASCKLKHELASDYLDLACLRETSKLNQTGLFQTQLECLFLRYHYQLICILFWYFVGGVYAALAYRCIYALTHQWPVNHTQYRSFGLISQYVVKSMQYIPCTISSILMHILFKQTLNVDIKDSFSTWKTKSLRIILLEVLSDICKIKLSQNIEYKEGFKLKSIPNQNASQEYGLPNAESLATCLSRLKIHFGLILGICLLVHMANLWL